MPDPDELRTLIERRDWLAARIMAKRSVGWETRYDEREHRALCWVLGVLAGVPSQESVEIGLSAKTLRA